LTTLKVVDLKDMARVVTLSPITFSASMSNWALKSKKEQGGPQPVLFYISVVIKYFTCNFKLEKLIE
jgi:hypothetical protein